MKPSPGSPRWQPSTVQRYLSSDTAVACVSRLDFALAVSGGGPGASRRTAGKDGTEAHDEDADDEAEAATAVEAAAAAEVEEEEGAAEADDDEAAAGAAEEEGDEGSGRCIALKENLVPKLCHLSLTA